jgi:hypothetical protein
MYELDILFRVLGENKRNAVDWAIQTTASLYIQSRINTRQALNEGSYNPLAIYLQNQDLFMFRVEEDVPF